MKTNLSFITDPRTSIPHIRASLDETQGNKNNKELKIRNKITKKKL